jgi:hypothetical protein
MEHRGVGERYASDKFQTLPAFGKRVQHGKRKHSVESRTGRTPPLMMSNLFTAEFLQFKKYLNGREPMPLLS